LNPGPSAPEFSTLTTWLALLWNVLETRYGTEEEYAA